MKLSEEERRRALQYIQIARAALDSAEGVLQLPAPPGFEIPQIVVTSALNVATALSRADAYQRAEEKKHDKKR